ncbi:Asp23/Gls24 family envelope stress response protein [Miniphocaeibacter massiliensis]|uniref:Asp23/Gls24 family envelope stress response protein n=1 Tax=Miniphocaeibacter massiliensis TaxID=2041841 RepID=UPI000C07EA27|nr:Asp23/Gls24 family envelope stress response protein [Miniphocaeibacter massiliensis]
MLNKNKFENGSVKISNDIINLMASTAALDVKGVHSLVGSMGEEITDPKKGSSKSTSVEIGRDYVIININIVLEYDSKIPEVAKKVQDRVKSDIENMTGLNVTQVNVNVLRLKNN